MKHMFLLTYDILVIYNYFDDKYQQISRTQENSNNLIKLPPHQVNLSTLKQVLIENRLLNIVVEYPLRDRDVLGSNPPGSSRVTLKTQKGTNLYSICLVWKITKWLCCRFISTDKGPWLKSIWKGYRLLDHVYRQCVKKVLI